MKSNILFFKNDDVRDSLDDSLVEITELFIENNIPITHAVEPLNVSKPVIEWLISVKKKHRELIEIMQHGYDHREHIFKNGKKGEFGGNRVFEEQYNDICKGKKLMDSYFGDLWTPIFNFPFGTYNKHSIKALDMCGYKIFNSSFNNKISRRILYTIGRVFHMQTILNRKISWNLKFRPNTNLFEIDNEISIIKKYLSKTECTFYTIQELLELTQKHKNLKVIGVLLHHRYHKTKSDIKLIEDYLKWIKQNSFICMNMKNIYRYYNKNHL